MIAYFMADLNKVLFQLCDPNKLVYFACLRSDSLIEADKNYCLVSFIFKSKINWKGKWVFLGLPCSLKMCARRICFILLLPSLSSSLPPWSFYLSTLNQGILVWKLHAQKIKFFIKAFFSKCDLFHSSFGFGQIYWKKILNGKL